MRLWKKRDTSLDRFYATLTQGLVARGYDAAFFRENVLHVQDNDLKAEIRVDFSTGSVECLGEASYDEILDAMVRPFVDRYNAELNLYRYVYGEFKNPLRLEDGRLNVFLGQQ